MLLLIYSSQKVCVLDCPKVFNILVPSCLSCLVQSLHEYICCQLFSVDPLGGNRWKKVLVQISDKMSPDGSLMSDTGLPLVHTPLRVESGPLPPLLNIYDVFLTDRPPATSCFTSSMQQTKSSLQKGNMTQYPTPNL